MRNDKRRCLLRQPKRKWCQCGYENAKTLRDVVGRVSKVHIFPLSGIATVDDRLPIS
ncbi:MAG: hypothetical protein GX799_10185 [Crenarchaeota archaeon]|nr:hypothetical protein [Thermoproteota archaeon]